MSVYNYFLMFGCQGQFDTIEPTDSSPTLRKVAQAPLGQASHPPVPALFLIPLQALRHEAAANHLRGQRLQPAPHPQHQQQPQARFGR